MTETAEPPHQKTAIIVGVLVAGLSSLALLTFLLVRRLRRQQYHELAKGNSDVISTTPRRRHRKSIIDDEEAQRRAMIRKSLATSISSLGTDHDLHAPDRDRTMADEEASVGLKEDWKEWEARLQQDQSFSLQHHPAIHNNPTQELARPLGLHPLDAGPPAPCHLPSSNSN